MYFDAHSDILSDVTNRRLAGETDILRRHHLDRLRRGQVEGSLFAIWVDPPYTSDYAARTRQIMDCARAEFAECDAVRVVHSIAEAQQAKADGNFYIFLGIEGLAAIGEDVDQIDAYYDFGCRHAILTWNEANALGAGATSGVDSGLTPAGKRAVQRIQRKGMLLDVSHLNEAGFWDVMALTTKPIVASHSNASALCAAPRNLTDDQLRAIAESGGVVGLNAFKGFISHDPKRQQVCELARHAAHMIELMGIDHVGCGFDFLNYITPETLRYMSSDDPSTKGLADCTEIDNLFDCLRALGLSAEEREKIAFRNFHRVIAQTVG